MSFTSMLRSVAGELLGLDKNDSLLVKGKQLRLDHMGADNVLEVVGGVLQVNGSAVAGTPLLATSVSATLSTSHNNYAPTGYVAGTTNRLRLTAAAGGSSLTGLGAAGDGFSLLVCNESSTDIITFAHLSSSSLAANRFACANAVDADLMPLACAMLVYVNNQWRFGS